MAFLQLLDALAAANGAPTAAATVLTITTVTKANLIDGERFTIGSALGDRVQIFEFDTDGKSVDADPTSASKTGPLNVALVDISAAVTADNVRDAVIAAINKTDISATATSGGAATVLVTANIPGPSTMSFGEKIANAGFTIVKTTAGSLSGVSVGADKEDLDTLDLWTTGATVAVNLVLTWWMFSRRSNLWLVANVGPVTPLVPVSGNNAGRSEILPPGLVNHDRVYLQAANNFGTGGLLSALLYSKGQRRTAA